MVLPDAALLSIVFVPTSIVGPQEEKILLEPTQFLRTEFGPPTPPTVDSKDLNEQFASPPVLSSLKANSSSNEESPRPRYYCDKCLTAFSRPDNLRRHLKRYCKKAKEE